MSTIISAVRAAGYWSGIAGRKQRGEGVARILLLHGTPQRDAAALERQLAYVLRWFHVVSLGELVSRMAGGTSLARAVAVTFDDGLRNNLTVAYPILRRLGVPATFFVCPGLIDTGKWLWTHQMRRRLQHGGPQLRRSLARQYGAHGSDEEFMVWMKGLDLASRSAVEQAVRAATASYRPSAQERHEFDLAGWDELRGLDPEIVAIGSHTMTHPILPRLSDAQCELELHASRRRIEEELQRPADLFAYPNGDHSPAVLKLAARHYRGAVTASSGATPPGENAFTLPRVGVPGGTLRLALAMHQARNQGPSALQTASRPASRYA